MTISPYAQVGPNLVAKGYSAIPIMPGSKRPGLAANHGMADWTRFCDRLPTDMEVGVWSSRPGVGVGVALGTASGGLVAIDIDSEETAIWGAVEALTGVSPVRKRGRKGYTGFFRASAALKSRPFKFANGDGVDLLAHGRQTVLPPTIHPDTGKPYAWLGDDTLEHVRPEHLPELPDDVADRLAEVLAPFGYVAQPERNATAHTDSCDDRWHETNEAALANLDAWVPHLGIGAKRNGAGWRAQAKWRNGDGFNVSFHPKGIKDFVADEGMTPIDVTMKALDMQFGDAADWLKSRLGIEEPKVEFTFRKAEETAPPEAVGDAPPPDPFDIVRMVRGVPEEALALASDDDEMAAWVACRQQEVEVFSEGVALAIKRCPADIFERHLISALVAVANQFDSARKLGFVVEVSRIVDWLEEAINALEQQRTDDLDSPDRDDGAAKEQPRQDAPGDEAEPEQPRQDEPKQERADGAGWPAPKPLPNPLLPVAEFDIEFLPECLQPWVTDTSYRMQCPTYFVGVSLINLLGAVIGRKVGIRPKQFDDWTEFANLWGIVVASPGKKKSPAMDAVLSFQARLIAQAAEKHAEALSEFRKEHKKHELIKSAKEAKAKLLAKKAVESGDDDFDLVPLHRGFDGLKFNGGLGGPGARPESQCCARRPRSA